MQKQLTIRLNMPTSLHLTIFCSVALSVIFAIIFFVVSCVDGFVLINFLIFLLSIFSSFALSFFVLLMLYLFRKTYLVLNEEKIVKIRKNKIYCEALWDEVISIKYDYLNPLHALVVQSQSELQIRLTQTNQNPKSKYNFSELNMSSKDAKKVIDFYKTIRNNFMNNNQNKTPNCPCKNTVCANYTNCEACVAKHTKAGNLPSCKREPEISQITKEDYNLLPQFLQHSMSICDGLAVPTIDEILADNELNAYFKDFGKAGDFGIKATVGVKIIGLAWARIGLVTTQKFFNEPTPEIIISVLDDFRNKGTGTKLLQELLAALKQNSFKKAALFVNKKDKAVSLYKKLGFESIANPIRNNDNFEDLLMVNDLYSQFKTNLV